MTTARINYVKDRKSFTSQKQEFFKMKKSSKNKEILDEEEDSLEDEDFLSEEDEENMKERLKNLGYL